MPYPLYSVPNRRSTSSWVNPPRLHWYDSILFSIRQFPNYFRSSAR